MPVFDEDTSRRLQASIEAGQLVFLCGAGLSLSPPSNLLSAKRVAQECYDRWAPTEVLPPEIREDISQLAAYFFAHTLFDRFVAGLVPWDELVGQPNPGHAAVADLLISRAAHAALSANFDPLIEQWASNHKIAMRGALDGKEAVDFADCANPLLKFHGCLNRDREHTLWTEGQLGQVELQQRMQSCTNWMQAHLPGKDLLVVGFWTDWGYLNDALEAIFSLHGIGSITVVDPLTTAELKAKAPAFWSRLTGSGAHFQHLQASGDDALQELRMAFSTVWCRKFFSLAKPYVEAEGGIYSAATSEPAGLDNDDLYNLRRDSEGVPYSHAARERAPAKEAAKAAFAHMLLIQAGATRKGAWYTHKDKTIRIVHGSGQYLESVRQGYNEPPTVPEADLIICAGADASGLPGRIVASGLGPNVVRASSGGRSKWLTLEEARQELAI